MTKKRLITAIVSIIIFLMLSLSQSLRPNDNQVEQKATPTPEVQSEQTQPTITENKEAKHGGVFAKISSVVDGDTVRLENGQVVRYIGIDTPETVDPRRQDQCYGQEASNKNKELVQDQLVELEKDISEKDSYGRLLRYVWVDEILINEVLVREGYAKASSYPPDVKYQNRFREAERLAREEKKGLWGESCR